jgi:lipoprotein signal peptidase
MSTKYWFPAKRYGWGWGFPTTWQGWLVFAAFLGLLVAGAFFFPPRTSLAEYLAYVAILCGGLVGICWLKGEPPRWRSG